LVASKGLRLTLVGLTTKLTRREQAGANEFQLTTCSTRRPVPGGL